MGDKDDEFNGYHEWLGIPQEKSPPNHYRLLGISKNEKDDAVIRASARKRRKLIQSKQGQGQDDEVSEILYQIGEAEVTLVTPEMRREYNARMIAAQKRKEVVEEKKSEITSKDFLSLDQNGADVESLEVTTIKRFFKEMVLLVVFLLGGIFYLYFASSKDPVEKNTQKIVAGNTTSDIASTANVPNNTPPPKKAAKQSQIDESQLENPVTRIILSVNENGLGRLLLEKKQTILSVPSNAIPIKFEGFQSSKAYRMENNQVRLIHDFAFSESLESIFKLGVKNSSIESEKKSVVMIPQPEAGYDVGRVAELKYGRKMRLPMTAIVDVEKFSNAGFQINFDGTTSSGGSLIMRLFGPNLTRSVSWVDFQPPGTPKDQLKFQRFVDDKTELNLERGREYEFQLPSKVLQDKSGWLVTLRSYQVNVNAAPQETILPRFLLQGDPVPTFGMSMKESDNQVVIDRIFPSSAAEKAGLITGDIIISINDQLVANSTETLRQLAATKIGVDSTIRILRGGAEKDVSIRGQ